MKIIDCHAHIFPEKIANKAARGIGEFYGMPMRFGGTLKELMDISVKSGVSKCLVNSVATTPEQVSSINTFIKNSVEEHPEFFFGFAALHPMQTEEEIDSEFDFIKAAGLKGIKLHPDFQKFKIDDPSVYKIYERAEGNLPILMHTGDSRFNYSNPCKLKQVMKDFPKLTVIAAHFGGWSEWDEAFRELSDIPNIYVDTSSSLYDLSPETAYTYIKAFTPSRVLFGTDYPMWGADYEIENIKQIPLTDKERELIFYKNAVKLYNL